MQFNKKTLAATVVIGAALATAALAQFGGTPNPPGANPFSGPANPGAPLPAKPFGRMPFASGTVSAVDAATGTITLTPMFGTGPGQIVKVAETTQVTAQMDSKVSELKVGDRVRVNGVPTGMTASQITAGDSGDMFMGGPFGPIKPVGLPGANAPQGMANAQAIGKISSLSPLTVMISDTVSVILKPAPDVRVTKMVTEKAAAIKVGDRITANGQSDDAGVLTANSIRVNMDNGLGRPMPKPLLR